VSDVWGRTVATGSVIRQGHTMKLFFLILAMISFLWSVLCVSRRRYMPKLALLYVIGGLISLVLAVV
jgi:hypothetical protein